MKDSTEALLSAKEFEDRRARAIRSCIRGFYLIPNIAKQIEIIASQTIERGDEVGGSLFNRNNCLEMIVIASKLISIVQSELDKFSSGNYADTQLLYNFALDIMKAHASYLPVEHPIMNQLQLCVGTIDEVNTAKQNLVTPDLIKQAVNIYKRLIIGDSYTCSLDESGINQEGFLGKFHTHTVGGNPSPSLRDIQINSKFGIPELVIAPTKSGKGDIYLITKGKSEVLYRGIRLVFSPVFSQK